MPEVKVSVGGREYEVACQEGEENFLRSAAALLDAEATVLGTQSSRLPESRVLLMAGLMLADKTAGIEDQIKLLEGRLAEAHAEIAALQARPPVTKEVERVEVPVEVKVEVPVLPEGLAERLDALAGKAEGLAAEAEQRCSAA
ncbi:cell division protein ZapA [Frigidibacter sp. ROC022]|uniref:cell division protein ZapA n=1 Tax=Frigidibacter sp. ROC022 TaxID=2971796 RepID=UPI00215B4AF5|nr:cell division protein ZapA [Frigidibacter sp. ROC022]MCR8723780.1 cell division protein ZapA [Frigidibacter sp. ROC022]